MKGISSKAKVSKKLTKKTNMFLDLDNKTANHGTMKRIISATYKEIEYETLIYIGLCKNRIIK